MRADSDEPDDRDPDSADPPYRAPDLEAAHLEFEQLRAEDPVLRALLRHEERLRQLLAEAVADRQAYEAREALDAVPGPPGYVCPHCGAVSHNPNDRHFRYCSACGRFAP